MKASAHSTAVLSELAKVMADVDDGSAERLAAMTLSARRIFVAGCGRSGLMGRAFAMRLMHLGCTAFVVGDTTTPAIGEGDLLIVCSGRGRKKSLLGFMEEAAGAGAHSAVVTAAPGSPLAQAAELVVVLPAAGSRQFGGSLFEQALLVFFDSLTMGIIEHSGMTHQEMAARHANLE